MTIEEQLAALEEVAGEIDPGHNLAWRPYGWAYRDDWRADPTATLIYQKSVGLAIRIKQAMDWLTAWCRMQGREFSQWDLSFFAGPAEVWILKVFDNRRQCVFAEPNESLAHALRAAVKELTKGGAK